jgi:hypothetical protein
MNIDRIHTNLRQATAVLDAGIAAQCLSTDELRDLMHVALDLIESAHNESIDAQVESRPCQPR